MFIAINEKGYRVHIEKTNNDEQYFCPTCGEKLILKRGDIRIHHFAHYSKNLCKDTWDYDMSYWHQNWQSKFPIECQEVVKELNGEKHRADVLIEDAKVVIEFQHSKLSFEEFNERNTFYKKLGYKVIWIFDVVEEIDNCELFPDEERKELYRWKNAKWKFNKIDLKDNVLVYFQSNNHFNDDEKIKMYLNNPNSYSENSELSKYYFRHQCDSGTLMKVDWVCDEGFKVFISNFEQSVTSFLNKFSEYIDITFSTNIKELNDNLTFMGKIKKVRYFYGCPLAFDHICIDSRYYADGIDAPCCEECEYGYTLDEFGQCKKAIHDLKIDGNSKLKGYTINSNGIITKIKYEVDSNIYIKEKESYDFKNIYDSIPNIWSKYNLKIATFKNVVCGEYVRITDNPLNQLSKYRNIYGKKSKNQMSFNDDSVKIIEANNKCWILVWSDLDYFKR